VAWVGLGVVVGVVPRPPPNWPTIVSEVGTVFVPVSVAKEGGIETVADRDPILPRAHIKLPDLAHLQVFWGSDVAVPEVSASIRREVVRGSNT
jgi:hypothetical protein